MGTRRVAMVGLGKMGGPMALHLHEKGLLAAIYSPRTAKEFAARNNLPSSVRLAASPADATRDADTVLVSVPLPQVEPVLFGANGVADGMSRGLVIESGNSDHRRDPTYESWLAKKGVAYLDAAVSGGPKRARAGTLVSIVGGRTQTFEKAREVFEAFSKPDGIFHVGPTGQGHEAKMYHNQDEQNDMRNIGEAISLLMATGLTFRDTFRALDRGSCKSALLTYAGMIPDNVLPTIAAKIGGGDLPQIAVETATEIGHPTPLTMLTLNLRRFSRGEMTPAEVATRASADFAAKRHEDILRLYNLLRSDVRLGDLPGDGDVQVVARALALGYLLDLAEVVVLAFRRRLDLRILARIFRAGLCDKAALDPLLSRDLTEVHEFPATLPEDDRNSFEAARALGEKHGHPMPSAAAYMDLGSGRLVANAVAKLADPAARGKYGNALRIQAAIRDAFGEHGYEAERTA